MMFTDYSVHEGEIKITVYIQIKKTAQDTRNITQNTNVTHRTVYIHRSVSRHRR